MESKKILKNIFYSIFSNATTLLISTFITLVIPKILGVKEFGNWQLYIFYTSYVGLLHFGWNDGIYLRYAGYKYEDLEKRLFFTQFIILVIFQIIIAIIFIFLNYTFIFETDRLFIKIMVFISMVIVNTRLMYNYILQITLKIKEYTKIIILEKIGFIICVLLFFLLNIKNYKIIIISDILGKLLSLFYAFYICNDIFFSKLVDLKVVFKEIIINIKVGSKLMIANFTSILILGVVRFGIIRQWDIETFGKVSLTLSISNMIMLFINAIGIVIYPILKRKDKNKLKEIYLRLREVLLFLFVSILGGYYPLKILIGLWLPEYKESLIYMGILFPMYMYEGKIILLFNTYLKTFREEKKMLIINIIVLVISLVLTFFTTIILKNLDYTVSIILIILIIKSFFMELIIVKKLQVKILNYIKIELLFTILFVVINFELKILTSILIYSLFYFVYLVKNKEKLVLELKKIKKSMY